ncbi:MAG: sulfatase [Gemmataceae bacterium]
MLATFRCHLWITFAIGLLLGAWTAPSACQAADAPPPNIVFAFADDWGWPHAGIYGDPVVKTPTFDRMAREGVLFTNAYVSSPSCTPSRAAILTGQWHWRLEESANLWSTLQTKFSVYPDLLEEAGYHVGMTRKGWGPGRFEVGSRKRNPAGPNYKDFNEFLAQRPAGKPFCFWFGSSDPHRPYAPGSGAKSGMDLNKIKLPACFPDNDVVRGDVADYYFEVERFDREVGEIVNQLAEMKELDNTILVISGDHGMPFPRCKGHLYDTGTRVPLAIRWGRKVPAGRTVTDFVSLTDLAPTFLEAAGLKPPDAMTGRSLVPILLSEKAGRVDDQRASVIFGKERHTPCQEAPDSGGTPMRAIRTDDFLYIRNFRPDRWPAGTPHYEKAYIKGAWYGDTDNGPTKTYMIEHKDDPQVKPLYELAFAKRPAEELYDLKKDPDQLRNVAGDPKYAAVQKQLAERLLAELKASDDPRVRGDGDKFDTYPYYGGVPRHPSYEKKKN